MAYHDSARMMIAAPQGIALRLGGILATAGIEPDEIVNTGEEALCALDEELTLLLTTWKLNDMKGDELAEKAGERANVLMIVPQDYGSEELPDNALLLHNPISQDALIQSVRAMLHCHTAILQASRRADKLALALEERKIIDRAKGRLMDEMHMSEKQAHYYIQKRSMDSGRRISDIAKEVLESTELRMAQ